MRLSSFSETFPASSKKSSQLISSLKNYSISPLERVESLGNVAQKTDGGVEPLPELVDTPIRLTIFELVEAKTQGIFK
jgi:hypothetical protein